MTPNEQKAVDVLRTKSQCACKDGRDHEYCPERHVTQLAAAGLIVTDLHERALAMAERCSGSGFVVHRDCDDMRTIGRESLAAKKPKERWTVEGHSDSWALSILFDGKYAGRSFPRDAEPEARAYVARKNEEENK